MVDVMGRKFPPYDPEKGEEWEGNEELCQGCGKKMDIDDGEYCMECLVCQAEDQGFRWGHDR